MPLGEALASVVKYRVVDCLHRRAVSGQYGPVEAIF